MTNDVTSINILPAIFIGYREDGSVLLNCYYNEKVEKRAFQQNLIKRIENPKYLLLGILINEKYVQLNLIDGTDYKDLFEKKWKILL